jgi:hypothetical protein
VSLEDYKILRGTVGIIQSSHKKFKSKNTKNNSSCGEAQETFQGIENILHSDYAGIVQLYTLLK